MTNTNLEFIENLEKNKHIVAEIKAAPSNFLRSIIEHDLLAGTYANRFDANGRKLPEIITRFPPEPNGYLHIGHAKSICLNFGIANDYAASHGARCHMRFDDTNPDNESIEYANSILESVKWLGFSWENRDGVHLHYASDYFDHLYKFAQILIEHDAAYVDDQTSESIRLTRGTLTQSGVASPFRNRNKQENLALFADMKNGKYPDGACVLRAKIDMAAPNIIMRDPIIYRIRHASHIRTKDTWCIYPMYDFTHCISDAIEYVTHSFCTLEFENNRPLYDWILQKLCKAGVLAEPLPKQYEFARLNLNYTLTSKRQLSKLITSSLVNSWDDPRMPTIIGLRRRGFTAESIRLFCERIGVAKVSSQIEFEVLEQALRDNLATAPRAIAILDPIKLIIDNFPAGETIECEAPIHPQYPELGKRSLLFENELWIERNDFKIDYDKNFYRLYPAKPAVLNNPKDPGTPGSKVRLRYGFVVECTGYEQDQNGNVTAVHANYFPDSKSGTDGANLYKVKGNIHWLSCQQFWTTKIHLYNQLFLHPQPNIESDEDIALQINPNSKRTILAHLELRLKKSRLNEHFQFERQGYFAVDLLDPIFGPTFNRIACLKETRKSN